MPEYKLYYFNLKGRAEPIRVMFQLAGVAYEDIRIEGGEEWAKLKPTMGLGQIPVLKVDGKELPQSLAICRYVAKEHGFLPQSSWEQAWVDVVIETIGDMVPDFVKIFGEKDENKKAEVRKSFADGTLKRVMGNLETILKKNNGGAGWFVGEKITLADVLVFQIFYDRIPFLMGLEPGTMDVADYPLLKGFIARFEAEPKVAEWLKKRPVTRL